MSRIVCFHLYNDYSGSPKVLSMILDGILKRGFTVDLITSRGGILDELKGSSNLKIICYSYKFSENHFVALLKYMCIQIYTFFIAFRYFFCSGTVFYINTLLPLGPAVAGFLMRKKVIYHYHENAVAKGFVYRILCNVMQKMATQTICVSEYQAQFLNTDRKCVIPNAVSVLFEKEFLRINSKSLSLKKNILMLSSLKKYKGIKEFIELSNSCPNYNFTLIISDTEYKIEQYLIQHHLKLCNNMIVYSRQQDVISFYKTADLVLNLSNKEFFIETFGLTALEAMTAAIPVIVPPVGGIAELVEDGVNGYKIDMKELDLIKDKIDYMFSSSVIYQQFSYNAKQTSLKYNYDKMLFSVLNILK